MNSREWDLMSIGVDAELEELFESNEVAWFGERRNYATEGTEESGSQDNARGNQQAEGPDEIRRLLEEEEGNRGGPTGPEETEGTSSRSKAPNYYGPPG